MYYKNRKHFYFACRKIINGGKKIKNKRKRNLLNKISKICYNEDVKKGKECLTSAFYFRLKEKYEENYLITNCYIHALKEKSGEVYNSSLRNRLKNNKIKNTDNKKIKKTLDFINEIYHKFGVYFILNKNKEIIYIGKSINLGDRILASLNERNGFAFKILETKTKSDASFLENYFITKIKPKLNSEAKYKDENTFNIDEKIFKKYKISETYIYKFSEVL